LKQEAVYEESDLNKEESYNPDADEIEDKLN
jgi:hypothetical protein